MTHVSSLCVYCGSRTGTDHAYRQAAEQLGRLMAQHRIRLVYGGGRIGLMGVLADAVLAGGGSVVGIIPHHLEAREVGHRGVGELRVVDSMHSRKNEMFALADAFAVLPGGLGTLDETFEILTWRQLELHDKPIVLVNIAGYWDPFLKLLERIDNTGFMAPECWRLFVVVERPEDVIATIRRLPPPAVAEAPELL
jgi:hypothetical protein